VRGYGRGPHNPEGFLLTIFAMPKPFKGHFGVIQRNAISRLTRLQPKPEILLFGNEAGTTEIAQELGLRHIPDVKRNEYGTPLLSDLFEKAHALASNDTLCYVNADIMLLGDLMGAVQRVASWRERFLIVGRRTNVDLDEPTIYESADQEDRLRDLVSRQGQLGPADAIDYFVFPRGLIPDFPPFAIGRPRWDNWFLWKARASKTALVDASKVVLAVHQNHDYSHHPEGRPGVYSGEEAKQNEELAGCGFCTIDDATHELTDNGIRYNFRGLRLRAKRAVLPWWWAILKITGPLRHPLGLRRERISRLLGRIGLLSSR
jgi:hypothetical protein